MTLDEFVSDWQSDSPTLLVHTSGSTGKPKPMLVEKRRMEASARITCGFLGLRAGDTALLCMPLDFIAGKMVVVRSLVWGLQLVAVEPSGHPLKGLTESPTFAAMELRGFPNAVWSTYGMTETLSHIALRRLSGAEASEWYEPFDGVGVTTSADGCLVIDAPAVCAQPLVTNDIAEIAPDGRRFRIRGRRDNVVCSGGLKLQIEEMEARLQPHLNVPYMISKRPDDKFGEAVVLLAVTDDMESVCEVCRKHMPRYEQPRYFLAVSELPMTPTGKPARAEAMKLCAAMTSGK